MRRVECKKPHVAARSKSTLPLPINRAGFQNCQIVVKNCLVDIWLAFCGFLNCQITCQITGSVASGVGSWPTWGQGVEKGQKKRLFQGWRGRFGSFCG